MDLLDKIRQKARQEQEIRRPDASLSPQAELPEAIVPHELVSTQRTSDDKEYFQNIETATICNVFPEISQALPPTHRIVPRDPLEAILAGREATGCGDNLLLDSESQAETTQDSYQEFLCFKVYDEVYSVDIMDIKELITPREVTEVPRAPAFVSGIISLRGVIIPIIDMRKRLGFARETVTRCERIIVVRHGESFSGLLVDKIIQVVRIAIDDIETVSTQLEGIDRDFVTGIGRADGRMVIILNLNKIIDIQLS
jgi:purine-binding chemotaxis protein CheW